MGSRPTRKRVVLVFAVFELAITASLVALLRGAPLTAAMSLLIASLLALILVVCMLTFWL